VQASLEDAATLVSLKRNREQKLKVLRELFADQEEIAKAEAAKAAKAEVKEGQCDD
jgi:hypothetical protein